MRVVRVPRAAGWMVIGLALAGLTGCESVPKEPITLKPCEYDMFEPPRIVDRGITSATLGFVFEVTNPNPVPVILESMDLDPSINDGRMGRTEVTPSVTIGASQKKKVKVDYDLSYISAGLGIIDAIASGKATIVVEGTSTISCASNRHIADPLEHPINIR